MSASRRWMLAVRDFHDQTDPDPTALLQEAARYLEATADWTSIRDVMQGDLCWPLEKALEWFGEQDFGDFREAVNEGWGWND